MHIFILTIYTVYIWQWQFGTFGSIFRISPQNIFSIGFLLYRIYYNIVLCYSIWIKLIFIFYKKVTRTYYVLISKLTYIPPKRKFLIYTIIRCIELISILCSTLPITCFICKRFLYFIHPCQTYTSYRHNIH
jgi:hypothetical protein